jgi:hypothetical protein
LLKEKMELEQDIQSAEIKVQELETVVAGV